MDACYFIHDGFLRQHNTLPQNDKHRTNTKPGKSYGKDNHRFHRSHR